MRRAWTSRSWTRLWIISPTPTCSSSAAPPLVVYPAAGLVRYYRGSKLVVINKDATGIDSSADLCINAPIGQGALTAVTAVYHISP